MHHPQDVPQSPSSILKILHLPRGDRCKTEAFFPLRGRARAAIAGSVVREHQDLSIPLMATLSTRSTSRTITYSTVTNSSVTSRTVTYSKSTVDTPARRLHVPGENELSSVHSYTQGPSLCPTPCLPTALPLTPFTPSCVPGPVFLSFSSCSKDTPSRPSLCCALTLSVPP